MVWADKYHAMGYVSHVSANDLHLTDERRAVPNGTARSGSGEASQPSLLRTPLGRLRVIAFIEGCSYLLLLGVAMPLKYLGGLPLAVRIVGSIHGGLFLAFCAALLHVMIVERWSLLRGVVVFASSLVPCGTFMVDPSLRREQALRRHPSPPGGEISETAS
jgi:integral membrane protein